MFHKIMFMLFKHYGIDVSSAPADGHDVYIMTVEQGLDIHFIGTQENYLNMVCVVSELEKETHHQILYDLLASNAFSPIHPVLVVGLEPQSNSVMLSTRQLLAELNSVEIFRLVEAFIDEVHALREWLLNAQSRSVRQPNDQKQHVVRSPSSSPLHPIFKQSLNTQVIK